MLQRIRAWRERRDLNRRVRKVRIRAYNELATSWCDGSLARMQYDEAGEIPTGKIEVCLEGGLLIGGGFTPKGLYDFAVRTDVNTLEGALTLIEGGDEADYVPEGFDIQAVTEAANRMRKEIQAEARFRDMVQRHALSHENAALFHINDDSEYGGQFVAMEIIRDNLFDGFSVQREAAQERLASLRERLQQAEDERARYLGSSVDA